MSLKEKLPAGLEANLFALSIDPANLLALISTDLDSQGSYKEEWFLLSNEHVWVYSYTQQTPIKRFDARIDELKNPRIDSLIGGGALLTDYNNESIEIVRFTNAKERKFSRIGKFLKDLENYRESLKKGETAQEPKLLDDPAEHDWSCPKCGLLFREGSKICPKCLDKKKAAKRLVGILYPYWKQTVFVCVLLVASTALGLVPPYLTKPLVDNVLTSHPQGSTPLERISLLGLLVLALLGARLANEGLTILRGRILAVLGAQISHDLRQRLYNHLQILSLRFFDRQKVGSIMTRVTQDTESLQSALLEMVPYFAVQLFTFVGICVVLFIMQWKLTLLVLIPTPLVIVLTRIFWKWIHRLWHYFMRIRHRLNATVNESLSGIRVIKAFAQEDQEVKRFHDSSNDLRASSVLVEKTETTIFPVLGFIIQIGSLIIWYVGGRDVIKETITLGTLMTFISYLGQFYGPLQFLSRFTDRFARAFASAERVFEVLDSEPDVQESGTPVPMPSIKGHVQFKNVSFGYDKHKPILHEINLDVQPGEMIGLVGHSGAGKSTTINLVCRFYDVTDGEILIDGIHISDIPQHDLRSQIGVVLQDTFLFSDTIARNIAYSRTNATIEEIIRAAKAANAHDFIIQKPDGYDTVVGERGQMLSTGERQRISIARAILHNPRILILDEATASVDVDTEKQIQEAIQRLVEGRTTFAIAHRLSTLRNADRLIVLKEGKVHEMGTHDELLAKQGEFYRLVQIQSEVSKIKAIER